MQIPKLRLNDHYKTLSEASWDKAHKVPFIDSGRPVYLLDSIARKVCEAWRNGNYLSSADAYVEKDGKYYFIEFKNQKADHIDKREVQKKAFDSISIMRTALNQEITLDQLCRNAVFIVVFRDTEGYEELENDLAQFAKATEPVLFGLEPLKNSLYADVHTIPKAEFVRRYLSEIWNTPA